MDIVTLTLNPAIDVHCQTDRFCLHAENRAKVMCRHSGGKGINTGAALAAFGIPCTCVAAVGTENADAFLHGLSGLDDVRPLFIKGRVRENITVHASDGETRLSFEGAPVPADFAKQLYAVVPPPSSNTVLTLSGSLPPGFSSAQAVSFLRQAQERGARIAVDCQSLSLSDLFFLRPFLIKPNTEEAAALIGRPVTKKDAPALAEAWHNQGISHVLLSLGKDGLAYAGDDGVFLAHPPNIEVCSTVGAGDSAMAGFLAGQSLGVSSADCVRLAVAFGSAACLTLGNDPPRKEDIDRLLPQIAISVA